MKKTVNKGTSNEFNISETPTEFQIPLPLDVLDSVARVMDPVPMEKKSLYVPTTSSSITSRTLGCSIFPVYPDVNINEITPAYGTSGSACFDLKACLAQKNVADTLLTYYDKTNRKGIKSILKFTGPGSVPINGISIDPGERVLVPTGFIFDIPPGMMMKIYPRSGLSLKQGIKLFNCTGIIDSDYVEPTFITVENTSFERVIILHGDRIAQAEIVDAGMKVEFKVTDVKPEVKTDRVGGFGHTGVSV